MTVPTAQDRYVTGLQLFRSANYHLAEKMLREALAIDPGHHLSHALLALSLQYLGRSREALDAADAALAIHPTVDALRARALAELDLGDLRAAVAAAEDAIRLMPSSAWAAHTAAWALERSQRFDDAETQYRRGADLAPDNMALRAELGRFLIRRRRLAEAEAIAASIASHVESSQVILLRGEIALRRDRLDEARELALWLLSRNAQHRQAITLLSVVSANRNIVRRWLWHADRALAFRPRWQVQLAAVATLVAILATIWFWLIVAIYLRLTGRHLQRPAEADLGEVRLRDF